MDASDLLLEHWIRQVKELFPTLHHYQQESLALCVQGVVQSGTAVMQRVAETLWEQLSSETKLVSYERRLQRFVANERIEVQTCWKAFLQQVLPFWKSKPVTLILDLTPYTQEATIVYLGILVQSRILPVAWCVMPQKQTWDQGLWEIVAECFELVAPHLTGECTLLADRGLSCLALIELCKQVGWHYVLRIKNEEWCRRRVRQRYRNWQQGKHFVNKPGQQWYGEVMLWKEHQFATWLSASWEPGYEEAWFLISDRPASRQRVSEYGRRMRVEATFQDQKSRGCMMEGSRFKKREHLNRWLLVVYLAIWWIAHLGSSCMHHGHRAQVDRKDRRDKGLLRIGRLWRKSDSQEGQSRSFSREPKPSRCTIGQLPALLSSKEPPVFLDLSPMSSLPM
jgi:hypothetical protein